MNPARGNGKLDGLVLSLFAGQIFLLLSFLRLWGDTGSAAFGKGVIGAILSFPIVGTKLGLELARFAVTLVLLHFALGLLAFGLARVSRIAWPTARTSQRTFAVLWFVLLVTWLLSANAAWYPHSSLGEPYAALLSASIGGVSWFSTLSTVLGVAVVSAVTAALLRSRDLTRSKSFWVGSAAVVSSIALPVFDVLGKADDRIADDRPHVIVIGVDSLRADYVQNAERSLTPALDGFLAGAIQFSDAYTPLARTFPAWVSIVSGRHPHATGAFVNLLPRELIHEGETMPDTMRANGYRTVYAIDEVRFSNLDESYGFEKVLTPPMGAADFMLGFFADAPLANVLVNTGPGKWLFPYGYANRAAAVTYDPDTFIERIGDSVEFGRPTMLAIHLTLVHWPYSWASAPMMSETELHDLSQTERAHRNYDMAVSRVDEQFSDLMALLEEKGALENAIVVLLSDHGESLGESAMIADRDEVVDQRFDTHEVFGHGTHVFSSNQYHVVLGMRAYGTASLPGAPGRRVIDAPVSLEDVAPTVLDLLDLDAGQPFDGRSLLPHLRGAGAIAEERVRFLETEFNPPGLLNDGIPSTSAVLDAVEIYAVDPQTDRVTVRRGLVDGVLEKRQYAAEINGHMLAAFPAARADEQYLLYFDSNSGVLRWLDGSPSASDGATVERLWHAMQNRFAAVSRRRVASAPAQAASDKLQ